MDSMIVNTQCDLCICCSWTVTGNGITHRVSGHMFEMIEYYYIMRSKYSVKILFGDPKITREVLNSILHDKYTFTTDEINEILDNVIYTKTAPKYVIGKMALFVDGCLCRMEPEGIKLVFDKIYSFKCSNVEHLYNLRAYNVIPLLDKRVYIDTNPEDVEVGVDYRKKMLISKIKTDTFTPEIPTGMLYLTNNCRSLSIEDVVSIIECNDYKKYVIITDVDNYNSLESDTVQILKAPVRNFFKLFTGYIYTPLKLMWDGSPRLPVECVINNKQFTTYMIDESYLSKDRGLYYRLQDIKQNFKNLSLTDDDKILSII